MKNIKVNRKELICLSSVQNNGYYLSQHINSSSNLSSTGKLGLLGE